MEKYYHIDYGPITVSVGGASTRFGEGEESTRYVNLQHIAWVKDHPTSGPARIAINKDMGSGTDCQTINLSPGETFTIYNWAPKVVVEHQM